MEQAGYVIVVEGESDCWICWTSGFSALGLPNHDGWRYLRAEDLAGVTTIYLSQESGDPRTFPDGIERYYTDVVRAVRELVPGTEVRRLRFEPESSDLGDLWEADPAGFAQNVDRILRDSSIVD